MARREKRKRAHISKDELLATALTGRFDPMPAAEVRELRERAASAQEIIRLFTPDHQDLHALGGADTWGNLWLARRGPALKAKDARDTSIVAKHDRITAQQREHLQAMARKLAGPSPFVDMPERGSRASRWPQGRKLQGGSSFQRRR
jgi:hypothetical protein